jgi:hypothetical protein
VRNLLKAKRDELLDWLANGGTINTDSIESTAIMTIKVTAQVSQIDEIINEFFTQERECEQ